MNLSSKSPDLTLGFMILRQLLVQFVVNILCQFLFADKTNYMLLIEFKKVFNFDTITFVCKKKLPKNNLLQSGLGGGAKS
jgi:hypothetical protein